MKVVHIDNTSDVSRFVKLKQVNYRARFVINKGESYHILAVEDVAYFHVTGEILHAIGFDQKRYLIDMTMKSLEDELNPNTFFRVNRQYIVNINCIRSFENYFNGKLVIKTNPSGVDKIIISRKNALSFRKWVDS